MNRSMMLLCAFALSVGAASCLSPSDVRTAIYEEQARKAIRKSAASDSTKLFGFTRNSDVATGVATLDEPELRKRLAKEGLEEEVQESTKEALENKKELFGTQFGIAPSLLIGGDVEIVNAELTGPMGSEVVRVTKRRRNKVSILFETHHLFIPKWGNDKTSPGWGFGPFLALGLGDDDIVTGLGGGLLVAFAVGEKRDKSFNIGFGGFLEEDVQQLASGFADGSALPAGENQIRYVEKDEFRWLAMFSFTFKF